MPSVAHRGRGRRTINEINMVPFIDVMLVLLIIFMVTAPLIAPSVIDLPSVGKAAKQPDQVVQIIIGKDEVLQIKRKDSTSPVNLKQLAATIRREQSAVPNTAGGDQC
jgi:biopolymer transport protein TolR